MLPLAQAWHSQIVPGCASGAALQVSITQLLIALRASSCYLTEIGLCQSLCQSFADVSRFISTSYRIGADQMLARGTQGGGVLYLTGCVWSAPAAGVRAGSACRALHVGGYTRCARCASAAYYYYCTN